MLGRTELRTRDRIYCQTMRTVRDISRDDRARIATCSLRTQNDRQTDRLKVNYSIDDHLSLFLNVGPHLRPREVQGLSPQLLTPIHLFLQRLTDTLLNKSIRDDRPSLDMQGHNACFHSTVEPLTNDHPHQRPSLSYDHISCDGLWFLFVYESLTSDHPSYTTTPM